MNQFTLKKKALVSSFGGCSYLICLRFSKSNRGRLGLKHPHSIGCQSLSGSTPEHHHPPESKIEYVLRMPLARTPGLVRGSLSLYKRYSYAASHSRERTLRRIMCGSTALSTHSCQCSGVIIAHPQSSQGKYSLSGTGVAGQFPLRSRIT